MAERLLSATSYLTTTTTTTPCQIMTVLEKQRVTFIYTLHCGVVVGGWGGVVVVSHPDGRRL